MEKAEHIMLVRQRAVSVCVKRFNERALAFGSNDCVKMAALALRKQRVTVPLLRGVQYRSKTKALSALKASGCIDLVDAVDRMGFVRIAPAMTWPGDLIAMPASDGDPFGCSLCVVHTAGASRVLAVHEDRVIRVIEPDLSKCLAAWRVSNG